jgi:threonine dehydrogenase-like Zn-dependent dehydrogenase
MLAALRTPYRVVCVDPNPVRRAKARAMYDVVAQTEVMPGELLVTDVDEATDIVTSWGRGGCHAVLEVRAVFVYPLLSADAAQVVGNPSALTLSLALLAPTGVLSSCGVHQAPAVPFTGRALYNANATLEFGRCSVRAVFPAALRLLVKRCDVLGVVGDAGLVERVIGLEQAPEAYEKFNRGEWGKVVFDPWA